MKHSGRARRAATRIILWTLGVVLVLVGMGYLALFIGKAVTSVAWVLCIAWLLFALFTLYFFRDPDPRAPTAPGLVVAPGHGKVDVIDRVREPRFMDGECQRVSIFLSVFSVHVQNAPVGGRVEFLQYTPGRFLSALRTESAARNENILLGFAAADRAGARVGVRLVAGLIARRLVPWVKEGDEVARGERVSLIQFGSRVDVYLPLDARIKVALGARVRGGETVLAELA